MVPDGQKGAIAGGYWCFYWFLVVFCKFSAFFEVFTNKFKYQTKPNQTKPELTNESAAWCSLTGNINHSSEFGCIHED